MIEKIAIKLSAEWGRILKATEEDIECYRYGLELLFSTLCNLIFSIIISICLREPYAFLPYTIVYVPMRLYTGGYHASSHFKCITFSISSFLFSVIMGKIFDGVGDSYICMGILIVSFFVLRKLVPVASSNKPLTQKQEQIAKRNVFIIQIVLLFIWVVAVCTDRFWDYVEMCYFAELSVTFSVILGKYLR